MGKCGNCIYSNRRRSRKTGNYYVHCMRYNKPAVVIRENVDDCGMEKKTKEKPVKPKKKVRKLLRRRRDEVNREVVRMAKEASELGKAYERYGKRVQKRKTRK